MFTKQPYVLSRNTHDDILPHGMYLGIGTTEECWGSHQDFCDLTGGRNRSSIVLSDVPLQLLHCQSISLLGLPIQQFFGANAEIQCFPV